MSWLDAGRTSAPSVEAPGFDALYLHLPFCVGRCSYCSFPTCTAPADDPLIERYCDALALSLRRASKTGLLTSAKSCYLGGGTPSHVGGRNLSSLLYLLGVLVPRVEGDFELAVECNPESVTLALARDLFALGVTRFSLGVQSFDDDLLAALGRPHSGRQARVAIEALKERGAQVSADLICGIPGQTMEGWLSDLDQAIACGVDHLSVYPLTVDEGTPLAAVGADPDPDLQADMMLAAQERLAAAGLARYEVASYARPGCEACHNTAYWTGRSYLGLGVGAASMMTPEQWEELGEAGLFSGACGLPAPTDGEPPARVRASALPAGAERGGQVRDETRRRAVAFARDICMPVEVECLSARQAAAEDLMLGMRLVRGVPATLVERCRALLPGLDGTLAGLVADGLASWREEPGSPGSRLAPTDRGWLLGNELFERLWDLAG